MSESIKMNTTEGDPGGIRQSIKNQIDEINKIDKEIDRLKEDRSIKVKVLEDVKKTSEEFLNNPKR